jgi:UPF0755 protein
LQPPTPPPGVRAPRGRPQPQRQGPPPGPPQGPPPGAGTARHEAFAEPPPARDPRDPHDPHDPRDPRPRYADEQDDYGDDLYADEYDEDDDYVEAYDDRRPGRGRRRLAILAILVLVLGGGALAGWMWLQRQLDPPGGPGDTVTLEIAEGSSTGDIGTQLEDNGIIPNATAWTWYTRLRNPGSIQAGQYELRENSSVTEAIATLREGPAAPVGRFVTVPEGFTLTQTLARIADPESGIEGFTAEGLQAVIDAGQARSQFLPGDAPSIEGTLFPETYRIEEGEDEAALLTRMVEQFDSVMTELDATNRAQALNRTPYEIITIASMIEEETQVPEERAQVARVIYNRLDQGEPLGIDATSCYELGEYPCELTTEMLESDSPYNTRNRDGLPPTPIASPGRESIEAALNPADGEWLFYVLDAEADNGSHVFTETYEEFLAARARCQEAGLC